MNIVTIFSLTGGLGLFLYGMKLMSEGLEKAAGARMRSILEFFTKNRFVGMLVVCCSRRLSSRPVRQQ